MSEKKELKVKSPFEIALEGATSRMLSATSAFFIWKWINDAINTNSPGGEIGARRVAEILSTYAGVFQQIKNSSYKSFVADIWIFFDKDGYGDSFSVGKLIDLTEEKLSAEEIIKIKERVELIKRDLGLKIGFIQELRNADVAHQELDRKQRTLLHIDIQKLFLGVQEILNLITNSYNRSVWQWNHIQEQINHQMNWMIDNLERGEAARIQQIEEKWSVKKP